MPRQLDRFRRIERQVWADAGLHPRERRVLLRSGESVRVQEVGDGPPILFVHGVSNAGTSWVSLLAALEGFRCIALDRPGCGLSDPVASGPLRDIEAIETYSDTMLRDVLDALQLPSAPVAATSYGGYFAFRAAAAHPGRIERIVEFGWPMGAPMDKVPVSMRAAAIPGVRAISSNLPVSKGIAKMILRQVGLRRALDTGQFTDDMIDWFVSLLRDTDTMRNDMRSSRTVVTPLRGLNPRMLLPDKLIQRVTMPVLFLWGNEDPNGREPLARAFASRFPNAHLEVIPSAGHAPWIDEPDLCAVRTRAFLTA